MNPIRCGASSFVVVPACLGLLAWCAGAARGAVVFQSSTGQTSTVMLSHEWGSPGLAEPASDFENPNGQENFSQVAQRITLGGTDRFATSISMRLAGFRNLNAPGPATRTITTDVTMRVYQAAGGLPGAEVWSGTLSAVSLTVSGGTIGFVPLTFSPNVTLPDTMFVAISHQNISGDNVIFGAGCVSTGSPSVGSIPSPNRWAVQSTSTGIWTLDAFTPSPVLQLTINAVPSPGPVGAVAGACIVLGVRRRR